MTSEENKDFLSFVEEKEIIKVIKDHSPCYIINIVELERQVINFKNLFPSDTKFSYSYKTNYLKPIIEFLDSNSFLSEVVSPFEVAITKEYGINPKKIVFNGPAKNYDSINYVISNSGLVQIDNFSDLEIIEKLVESGKQARIGIRLNLSSFDKLLFTRFGFDVNNEEFKSLVDRINLNTNISLETIHTHIASRSISSFKAQFEALIKVLKNNKLLHKIKHINIGGGFPSKLNKFLEKQIKPEFNDQIFSKEVINFLNTSKKITNNSNLSIMVEPGTSIVAPVMSVAGNFYALKNSFNQKMINTNISRTDFGAMNNKLEFPFKHIPLSKNEPNSGKIDSYKLCGYTCVEKDILGNYQIKNPSVGDVFFLDGIGSYSQVNKSPFIGPELPLLLFDGKCIKKVREVESALEVTSRYI